ncbi:MAG: MotA/TolQ/ExbB proton channel family protein [Desulfuromonas thiophila]|nr:MotA/TolQ/ExbB proton channel family protein [Desulfuromonas thiophila]
MWRATDLLDYLATGGLVMLPLVLVSLMLWTLIFERLLLFRRLERGDPPLAELVRCWRAGLSLPPAAGLRSQLVKVLQAEAALPSALNRRLLDACALRLQAAIDRNLDQIRVLAAVAPLLGLLGTVTGMMATFDAIALFGSGNVRALAGGISEALITTQGGLLVSIPGVLASAVLNLRARRLQERLEETLVLFKRMV